MLSNETQSNLKQNILESFPKKDPPSIEDLIFHNCPECVALRNDFNGVRWWEAEHSLIYRNFAQSSLFTPFAYHFYFPAYLLHSLDDTDANYYNMIGNT